MKTDDDIKMKIVTLREECKEILDKIHNEYNAVVLIDLIALYQKKRNKISALTWVLN